MQEGDDWEKYFLHEIHRTCPGGSEGKYEKGLNNPQVSNLAISWMVKSIH